MYSKILVPIDLDQLEALAKALSTATDLAALYSAEVIYCAVSSNEPGHKARSTEDADRMLEDFAAEQGRAKGTRCRTHAVHVIDPPAELHGALLGAAEETGADLIVMASHVPGFLEHIFSSHGGYVASHAKISVMLVR